MIVELAAAALIAALAAAFFTPLVVSAGVIDIPDRGRKIHLNPTPTSGGLALGFGFALALAALALWPGTHWERVNDPSSAAQLGMAAMFSFAALLLGLWDDLRPLGPRAKMALMSALCLGVANFVARAQNLPVAGDLVLRLDASVAIIGSALWIFALMNATNFMDGVNGLALGCTAISLAGLAILGAVSGAYAAALMAVAGGGALVGLLTWNFPGGKIFAGDAGALFAGTLAGVVALMVVDEGGVTPFLMPTLFFPVLADAILTLAWRITQKRNLFDGHSEHFYQIALRAGINKVQITIWYWLATAGCVAVGVMAYVIKMEADITTGALTPSALSGALSLIGSLIVKLCLLALVLSAVWISTRVRRFSAARALDSEEI